MSKEAMKLALEDVYETIIQWDEGGGKRSRRELARRIVALAEQPAQPHKGMADYINQVTNGRVWIDPVTGDLGIGTPSLPAQRDIRNATLDEIATKIEAMPFGDTAASFAVWIREQKT